MPSQRQLSNVPVSKAASPLHGFGRVGEGHEKGSIRDALGLVCQGCFSREAPEVAAAVSPVNPEVEAARLIRTLDISTHLQDSARNYAAKRRLAA